MGGLELPVYLPLPDPLFSTAILPTPQLLFLRILLGPGFES
jgi:hypothetical protein